MEYLTEGAFKEILDAAREEGLPVGRLACEDYSATMYLGSRADVESWAERLETPVAEAADMVTTSFVEDGYTFRIVAPAAW
jgi:hypothetical protein